MAHGNTVNRREMAPALMHQLDVVVGDTIEITTISTTDGWHNARHALLFQKYVVTHTPKKATPHGSYNYANWMQVYCKAVEQSLAASLVSGGEFYFKRVQFRKVKSAITNFPATMTAREKMLDKINAELNIKDDNA